MRFVIFVGLWLVVVEVGRMGGWDNYNADGMENDEGLKHQLKIAQHKRSQSCQPRMRLNHGLWKLGGVLLQ